MDSAEKNTQIAQRVEKKAARRAAFIQEVAEAVARKLAEPTTYIKRQPSLQSQALHW
jgi:hypothetical protein